jgi:hypothetical protein
MFKRYSHYFRFALMIAPLLVAVLLLASSTPTQASAPAAPAAFYQCTADNVAAFTNRVHLHCTVAYNTNIYYFAYCSTNDSATASRMLSVFLAAKAVGGHIGLYFDPNDTSGTSCGCGSSDCRVVTGAEVRP